MSKFSNKSFFFFHLSFFSLNIKLIVMVVINMHLLIIIITINMHLKWLYHFAKKYDYII